MLKNIYNCQAGLVDPLSLKRAEVTRRAYSLQLSSLQHLQPVFSGQICSLDIDNSERRYLLSANHRGDFYIHDLYNFSGNPKYCAKCVAINYPRKERMLFSTICWYGHDNGMFVSSGSDGCLIIWDANSVQPVERFQLKYEIRHHALCRNATSHSLIAVCSEDKNVKLFDVRTGSSTHELRGHLSGVLSSDWSPRNENILATGGKDKKIIMWDIRSSKSKLKSLHRNRSMKDDAHNRGVNGLKFTKDGLLLLSSGEDYRLRLWETSNGHLQDIKYGNIRTPKGHCQFAITYDHTWPPLVFIPTKTKVHVIELFTGQVVSVLRSHIQDVLCCTYNEGSSVLYSGGKDSAVLVYSADQDLENGDQQSSTVTNRVYSDAWSSDEDTQAT